MLTIILALIIILFCSIVFFGAPFVPTKRMQIKAALDLLNLNKGDVLYDLGAGDGRVALAAAKRGIRVTGYELNFLLVLLARYKTRKYKNLVTIRWQNYWSSDFSKCEGVYIFSTDRHIKHLDKKLSASKKKLRLASYAFEIPGKKHVSQKDGVYLYEYEGVIK
jgi:methylase of polypeptide subunit release factors